MEIIFNKIKNHNELLKKFENIDEANPSIINLKINFENLDFIQPEFLVLLAAKVINLRKKQFKVNIDVLHNDYVNVSLLNYISRIDFFKQINYNFDESFSRNDSEGKFTEIINFDKTNSVKIADKIMKILVGKELNKDMLTALNFCIYEIIDNTLNHSSGDFENGNGSGFVVAQYFPFKKKFVMIVVDCGVGIHYALTKHPKSKYKELNEKKSVLNCIEKGVTNGNGKGFGLWASAEMIKLNGGELKIHSGKHCLIATNDSEIKKVTNWQGTISYLEVNTNKSVHLESIFGNEASERRELFEEYVEELNSSIKELW